MKDFSHLEKKVRIRFRDRNMLQTVFVHRSYLNEDKSFPLQSNEKLEFLGDSVLSLITSLYLYQHYPSYTEGDYTEMKAAIVRTESLAQAARSIELGDFIYLSKGQDLELGRQNNNILADTFEALIGAIFIDMGFEKAYHFIEQYLFKDQLDYIIKNKLYLSPKSRLQELTQARFKITPVYQLLSQEGPEHKRIYNMCVKVKNKRMGKGRGKSKKEAEENAAKNALQKMT